LQSEIKAEKSYPTMEPILKFDPSLTATKRQNDFLIHLVIFWDC